MVCKSRTVTAFHSLQHQLNSHSTQKRRTGGGMMSTTTANMLPSWVLIRLQLTPGPMLGNTINQNIFIVIVKEQRRYTQIHLGHV